MEVNGIKGLEKLAKTPIIPSTIILTRILKAIGENNAKLDTEATQELQNLFVKTGEMTGNLNKVISDSLNEASKNSHERCQLAILETLGNIDRLNMDGSEKSDVMKTAIQENHATRRAENKANADIGKIMAGGSAASIVILAASYGYKYARKPTFMESVQKIVKTIF